MPARVIEAVREHEIACGHRVYMHEGKCRHLHGHNYLVTFYCEAPYLDLVGRVIDFSTIKSRLCMWLEEHWDHRFLLWEKDPLCEAMQSLDNTVVLLPFNPTAENLAQYLLEVVGPQQLHGTSVVLTKVTVGETRKCTSTASLKGIPIDYYKPYSLQE